MSNIKIAQRRSLLSKLVEKTNLSGKSLEKFVDPEFKNIMDNLRQTDDAVRSLLSGDPNFSIPIKVENNIVLESVSLEDSERFNLEKLIKLIRKNINRKEYMTAVGHLGRFHKKINDMVFILKQLNIKPEKSVEKILFKDLSEESKKNLLDIKKRFESKSAQNQNGIIKTAGILDYFHNILTERGRALSAIEKIYPKQFSALKSELNSITDKSEKLLKNIISNLKDMSMARARRDTDKYMEKVKLIISDYEKYNNDFKNFFNNQVKGFLEKEKLIEKPSSQSIGEPISKLPPPKPVAATPTETKPIVSEPTETVEEKLLETIIELPKKVNKEPEEDVTKTIISEPSIISEDQIIKKFKEIASQKDGISRADVFDKLVKFFKTDVKKIEDAFRNYRNNFYINLFNKNINLSAEDAKKMFLLDINLNRDGFDPQKIKDSIIEKLPKETQIAPELEKTTIQPSVSKIEPEPSIEVTKEDEDTDLVKRLKQLVSILTPEEQDIIKKIKEEPKKGKQKKIEAIETKYNIERKKILEAFNKYRNNFYVNEYINDFKISSDIAKLNFLKDLGIKDDNFDPENIANQLSSIADMYIINKLIKQSNFINKSYIKYYSKIFNIHKTE